MDVSGARIVVTGAARGIGAALARRFAAADAAVVVVADLDGDAAAATAHDIGGPARPARLDVTDEEQVRALVEATLDEHGGIDLFCSNAGITTGAGVEATAQDWHRAWSVNLLSHVYAARAVLPSMLDRGAGYLLQTCSAAGLLTALGDAPYTVTKHAAVGFAEWLAVTYGSRGIRVSALCPQGVDTDMLRGGLRAGHLGAQVTAASGAVLDPAEVAEVALAGIAEERFLILPHPEVAGYLAHKTADPDRWLTGMRRLASGVWEAGGRSEAEAGQ
jgi:NAD(P)-dependent dehydrogenase (short-subunit alcohol dehydrogenase family)